MPRRMVLVRTRRSRPYSVSRSSWRAHSSFRHPRRMPTARPQDRCTLTPPLPRPPSPPAPWPRGSWCRGTSASSPTARWSSPSARAGSASTRAALPARPSSAPSRCPVSAPRASRACWVWRSTSSSPPTAPSTSAPPATRPAPTAGRTRSCATPWRRPGPGRARAPSSGGMKAATTHNGCSLEMDSSGLLWVGMGDAATPSLAQNRASLNGKVLRMTRAGGIPSTNPLIGGVRDRVYSLGHRNPQGLAIRPTGELLEVEHSGCWRVRVTRRRGWGSAATIHYAAEMMRRYYADRSEYLGDPDFYEGAGDGRCSNPEYIQNCVPRSIPTTQAPAIRYAPGSSSGYESTETTHFSIVDKAGNAVAVTYTLNDGYGSGVTVPGLGFLLNDEMDDFAAQPGSPNMFGLIQGEANAIQPGKRPLSSMTPTIVTRDGKLFMVVGAPGRRTHHHRRAADHPERGRFRHERAGCRRCAALSSSVEARQAQYGTRDSRPTRSRCCSARPRGRRCQPAGARPCSRHRDRWRLAAGRRDGRAAARPRVTRTQRSNQ